MGPSEGDKVPSIFDWPNVLNEDPNVLNSLHRLVLRLLYLPQFEVGQSKAETLREVTELIERSVRYQPK